MRQFVSPCQVLRCLTFLVTAASQPVFRHRVACVLAGLPSLQASRCSCHWVSARVSLTLSASCQHGLSYPPGDLHIQHDHQAVCLKHPSKCTAIDGKVRECLWRRFLQCPLARGALCAIFLQCPRDRSVSDSCGRPTSGPFSTQRRQHHVCFQLTLLATIVLRRLCLVSPRNPAAGANVSAGVSAKRSLSRNSQAVALSQE